LIARIDRYHFALFDELRFVDLPRKRSFRNDFYFKILRSILGCFFSGFTLIVFIIEFTNIATNIAKNEASMRKLKRRSFDDPGIRPKLTDPNGFYFI
jgi:hypothetical protein